jgi:TPR repeat protein
MLDYANALLEGIFGNDKISHSKKYYFMAIEHNHKESMFRFANALLEGIYGKEKIPLSEKYYLMAIEYDFFVFI